jgi:hypothetical protein
MSHIITGMQNYQILGFICKDKKADLAIANVLHILESLLILIIGCSFSCFFRHLRFMNSTLIYRHLLNRVLTSVKQPYLILLIKPE